MYAILMEFYVPRNIGNLEQSSQLTNSYIFQRGGPTTNQESAMAYINVLSISKMGIELL